MTEIERLRKENTIMKGALVDIISKMKPDALKAAKEELERLSKRQVSYGEVYAYTAGKICTLSENVLDSIQKLEEPEK